MTSLAFQTRRPKETANAWAAPWFRPVGRRHLTAETVVRSQGSRRSSCGGQLILGTLFPLTCNSPTSAPLYVIRQVCHPIAIFFPPVGLRPNTVNGLLILEVSISHTTTHRSRQDSSGQGIGPSRRHLPDNTQHSQQSKIHSPSGIRTHNLSGRRPAPQTGRPGGWPMAIINKVDLIVQYGIYSTVQWQCSVMQFGMVQYRIGLIYCFCFFTGFIGAGYSSASTSRFLPGNVSFY